MLNNAAKKKMKDLLQDSINKKCGEKLVDGDFIRDLIENFEEKRRTNYEYVRQTPIIDPKKIRIRSVKRN